MRKLLLTVSFILFSFLPFAYSQSYYAQNAKGLPSHNLKSSERPKPKTEGIDSSYLFINYYESDSLLYAPMYKGLQGQLLNSYYNFPNDTLNSYMAASMFFMNYDCINSIAVAFDSLVEGTKGYSMDTINGTQIDTLYIPIVQVNHSGRNDTLEIKLTQVDANGYPTSNYLLDTLVIGNSIGAGNDYTINTIKWNLNSYQLPSNQFGVSVTYYDATKLDSCWFIYGYGYYKNICPAEPTDTFAHVTHFSKIRNKKNPFFANSFAVWNQYTGYGFLPEADGNNVYFPCIATDTIYNDVADGANYLQNIDIGAYIFLNSITGDPRIQSPAMNIGQNYPNPCNHTTTINYTLTKQAGVAIRIVDLTGRELLSKDYGIIPAGQHAITLSTDRFSAGVYFYSITSSGYTVTKKMEVYK